VSVSLKWCQIKNVMIEMFKKKKKTPKNTRTDGKLNKYDATYKNLEHERRKRRQNKKRMTNNCLILISLALIITDGMLLGFTFVSRLYKTCLFQGPLQFTLIVPLFGMATGMFAHISFCCCRLRRKCLTFFIYAVLISMIGHVTIAFIWEDTNIFNKQCKKNFQNAEIRAATESMFKCCGFYDSHIGCNSTPCWGTIKRRVRTNIVYKFMFGVVGLHVTL